MEQAVKEFTLEFFATLGAALHDQGGLLRVQLTDDQVSEIENRFSKPAVWEFVFTKEDLDRYPQAELLRPGSRRLDQLMTPRPTGLALPAIYQQGSFGPPAPYSLSLPSNLHWKPQTRPAPFPRCGLNQGHPSGGFGKASGKGAGRKLSSGGGYPAAPEDRLPPGVPPGL